jgi:hypothetical protein
MALPSSQETMSGSKLLPLSAPLFLVIYLGSKVDLGGLNLTISFATLALTPNFSA